MNSTSHSEAQESAPEPSDAHADYRPDSASIIHTVANRRVAGAMMIDREAAQREQVERNNISLLLHTLHESAENHIPAAQRRLVRETEVQRAIAVLRRFNLLHPSVKLEQLLDHCEHEAAHDRDAVAHLIDPFQLRHVLTFHEGLPHEELTIADLYDLDRAIENGPESAIVAWFERIGSRTAVLPKSTPAYLRTVFERACADEIPAARLEVLAFELGVITLRQQGVIGLEDTRLFVSILKQTGGEEVSSLSDYLELAEVNHAASQHQSAGHAATVAYFRKLASGFSKTTLKQIEQRMIDTVAQRSAASTADAAATNIGSPANKRRGLFASLRELRQSLWARG